VLYTLSYQIVRNTTPFVNPLSIESTGHETPIRLAPYKLR